MLLHLKLLKPAKTLLSDAKNITTSYLTAYLKKKKKKNLFEASKPNSVNAMHTNFFIFGSAII